MKYAIVTGSTKGIGRAIGYKLLEEGYFVVFNYANSDDEAQKLREALSEKYVDKFVIIKYDLSDLNNIDSITNQLLAIVPKFDLLVFNAGMTDRSEFGNIKEENWAKIFNVNLTVPFFLMQKLVPHINNNGNVIFIGSMLGNIPHSLSISYGVSKSAIHALVKNMVKFLSPNKIRINAIAPGFVDTDWQKEKPQWLRDKIKDKVALKRFASEYEVADLCYNIVQSDYLTGQVIQLDGGYNYE